VVGREETTGPDGCTIGLLRWVEDVIRTKMQGFLLIVMMAGIIGCAFFALGLGRGRVAAIFATVAALAGTVFAVCGFAGVWRKDEWVLVAGFPGGAISADRPLSQDEVDEVMDEYRRTEGDGS